MLLMHESEIFLVRACVASCRQILRFLVGTHGFPLSVLLFIALDVIVLGCHEDSDAATSDADKNPVALVVCNDVLALVYAIEQNTAQTYSKVCLLRDRH